MKISSKYYFDESDFTFKTLSIFVCCKLEEVMELVKKMIREIK